MFDYTEAADESGLSKAYDQWKMDDYDSRNQWTNHDPEEAARLLDKTGWTLDGNGQRTKRRSPSAQD